MAALATAAAPACDWMYTADPPEVPDLEVADVQVIPSTVFVSSGAVFVMYVRIRDQQQGVLPEHPNLTWTLGSGLTRVNAAADSIVLTGTAAVGAQLPTSVEAQVGERRATARIVVLGTSAPGTLDTVLGDYRAGTTPDITLIDDTLATSAVNDSVVAFVGVGLLGDLNGGGGEVAKFSTDQFFRLSAVNWRYPSKATVDLRTPVYSASELAAAVAQRPRFVVWIATSSSDGIGVANADITRALALFRRQRTSLDVTYRVKPASGAGAYFLELTPQFACVRARDKLQALGVPTQALAQDSLNIVYVDDILDPPPTNVSVPVSSRLAGYSCPWDPATGAVVLLSRQWRTGTTLAHELGHALGLLEPQWGHTDPPAFGYTNLMWRFESDAGLGVRSMFTLGQAFRIHLDDHSWLRRSSATGRDCDSLGIGRSCPLLTQDMARLP